MKLAPTVPFDPRAWNRDTMAHQKTWQISPPPGYLDDLRALKDWALTQPDPLGTMRRESVETPWIQGLGQLISREIDVGSGVAWVRGLPDLTESEIRLFYLKLALTLGTSIDTYGRICDVHDTGVSYKDQPVPVSKTRESTGMHTDSSGKEVLPEIVGLACVRQAPEGGDSRIISAATVHEELRGSAPHLLRYLYHEFIRDLVTPGSERNPKNIEQNRFPIFEFNGRLKFRYMRYWIERGHAVVGEKLDQKALDAFDALDGALANPANILEFRMQPGDMLFIDNTQVAHDRSAFVDNPQSPRLMLRTWLHHPFRVA